MAVCTLLWRARTCLRCSTVIPEVFWCFTSDSCEVFDLDSWLQGHALVLCLLQLHLELVCARMKHQADKKRSDRLFKVVDLVFLKLQP